MTAHFDEQSRVDNLDSSMILERVPFSMPPSMGYSGELDDLTIIVISIEFFSIQPFGAAFV